MQKNNVSQKTIDVETHKVAKYIVEKIADLKKPSSKANKSNILRYFEINSLHRINLFVTIIIHFSFVGQNIRLIKGADEGDSNTHFDSGLVETEESVLVENINSGVERELETLLCKESQYEFAISESGDEIFLYEEEKDLETAESDSSVLENDEKEELHGLNFRSENQRQVEIE